MTRELAARGYKAVDLDNDEFSEWWAVTDDQDTPGSPVVAGRDWVWREDRVQELLSNLHTGELFVSGSAMNMGKFLPQFDIVILLSAPAQVIVERLAARTDNPYGKKPEEVDRVLDLRETVEPLLRRAAGHEIDTSASLEEVVAAVLRIVHEKD